MLRPHRNVRPPHILALKKISDPILIRTDPPDFFPKKQLATRVGNSRLKSTVEPQYYY